MHLVRAACRGLLGLALTILFATHALAANGAAASAQVPLIVDGISVPPHGEDLLGIARLKFHGLIAGELRGAGYVVVTREEAAAGALTLVGLLKEEICEDQEPPQCRVSLQWQLEDAHGVVVYRTTARAVEQAATLDAERRNLVLATLRSLLQRPRFALALTPSAASPTRPDETLGFKRCGRPPLELPRAMRGVAAALVHVQSGSDVVAGTIVSGDGLVLTSARSLSEHAPLQVRFMGGQSLPAEIVALEREADVALLHVQAHTDATCVPLREDSPPAGAKVFGVGSDAGQDAALSLSGGSLEKTSRAGSVALLQVDAQIARSEGGPLLDEQGRLVGVISAAHGRPENASSALSVEALSALVALRVRPATATDPRLLPGKRDVVAWGYVRDADDPPFVLTRRYTFGTSSAAHTLRRTSAVVAVVGALGVGTSWIVYRLNARPSPAAHDRSVIANDLSWIVLGLGAVGLGVSYALPEGHDHVAAESASRRLFFRVGAAGAELGATL